VLVKRGWMYRRVRLHGGLAAEIEWNARWPVEVVRVNGRKVAARHAFWFVPRFTFDLETTIGRCQVTVEVRVSLFLTVTHFQISVNDQAVYREGASRNVA
jgi:hypothetical protein